MWLNEYCGGSTFLNASLLNQELPVLTPCFLDTVSTLIPCGFFWVVSPFFLLYLVRRKDPRVPPSYLHIMKTVTCVGLACILELQLIMRQRIENSCGLAYPLSAATYVTSAIKFATFVLAAVLLQVQKRFGSLTSGVPFLFWLLLVVMETLQFYNTFTTQPLCPVYILFYVYYALVLAQFLMHCWAERRKDCLDTTTRLCPELAASVLNQVTFSWMTGTIIDCYRKRFSKESFWEQTPAIQSCLTGPDLEQQWKKDTEVTIRVKRKQKTPSWQNLAKSVDRLEHTPLLGKSDFIGPTKENTASTDIQVDEGTRPSRGRLTMVLLKVFWLDYATTCFYSLVSLSFFILSPVELKFVINMISEKEAANVPLWQGIMYAVTLYLTIQLSSIYYHIGIDATTRLGLKVKVALMYLIYKKALTLSRASTAPSVGETVSLMSVDCQRIQDAFFFSFYSVSLVFAIGASTVILWYLVGTAASITGLALVFLLIICSAYIGVIQHRIQEKLLQLKGRRIRLLHEVLTGIKVLKMYCWEPSFLAKVTDIRNQELQQLMKNSICLAVSTTMATLSAALIHYGVIMVYTFVVSGLYLSSDVMFVALSICNIIRYPLSTLPSLINGIVQTLASLARINNFLSCANVQDTLADLNTDSEYAVRIEDGHFSWEHDIRSQAILQDVNLDVKKGQLVAVVGLCGTGKSSLLSAILRDMLTIKGRVTVKGGVAYVPQEAWIQNMTVRESILFGKKMNDRRYKEVIKACCLRPDIEALAGGDLTEIGEKGTNISGGQKQRISLARAVYQCKDIYLLDDPLSAVDSHVGKDLFKNVISNAGLLKHKTRILVTNAMHWLPFMDKIVVMDNCRVSEVGSLEELMHHNGPFAQFLHQHLRQPSAEEDCDPELDLIRTNMLEQVELVTSDGGFSSDDLSTRRYAPPRRRRRTQARAYTHTISEPGTRQLSTLTPVERFGTLVTEETQQQGSVKLGIAMDYAKAMGTSYVVFALLLLVAFQSLSVYSMFWLTFWTEDTYMRNQTLTYTDEYNTKFTHYLTVYTVFLVVQGFPLYLAFHILMKKMVTACGQMHDKMLRSVLRAPMSFFDTTPVGRILNRFSSDIDTIDNKLPESFRLWSTMISSTLASIVVMCASTPIFIIVVAVAGFLVVYLMVIYLPTARQMRRVESVTRTPIYNHFSETMSGASVIRAFQCAKRFVQDATRRIDNNNRFFFAAYSAARWVGIRLEILGNLLLLCCVLIAFLSDTLNGSELGLSVNYAVQVSFALQVIVYAVAELEMNLVATERVIEYTNLPEEADWIVTSSRPSANWPSEGVVEYRNYSTRYRPGLELVLKGITFTIHSSEKVGIVGRTGAGKSSLTLSLFRLIEAANGCILIDGVRIADLGLHDLRTRLTILPQDPVLFSGSLRMNIDPMDEYSDNSIWNALEHAHLKSFAMSQPSRLQYDCGSSGQNLSAGQRQLVCLARALLHKTNILILDEATAAVDMETDTLIQETIRTQFRGCTIITIAHRLNTIMDYDRVMVLNKGDVIEFDRPSVLLRNDQGVFYSMAKDAGII